MKLKRNIANISFLSLTVHVCAFQFSVFVTKALSQNRFVSFVFELFDFTAVMVSRAGFLFVILVLAFRVCVEQILFYGLTKWLYLSIRFCSIYVPTNNKKDLNECDNR